jgi:hypothetical protein
MNIALVRRNGAPQQHVTRAVENHSGAVKNHPGAVGNRPGAVKGWHKSFLRNQVNLKSIQLGIGRVSSTVIRGSLPEQRGI